VLSSLGQPKVAVMLLLGFSSGLPFFLSGNTLGYWLRDNGTTLAAIGFLSWVGLAYSLKFLWAPIVDRTDAPIFGRFGRRRGWMILSQIVVALGLTALAAIGLSAGLATVGVFALVVAFSSSTQDIVVDAWRIEAASDSDELGLLSSAYQLGYRAAIIVTDAFILIAASHFGWRISYGAMAVLMAVGIGASLVAVEPLRAARGVDAKAETPLWTGRGLFDAVIGPFTEFFRIYGWLALLMLAMISFYQLPEFVMGPMANPFYHDLGLSKDAVGAVRGSIGHEDGGDCQLRDARAYRTRPARVRRRDVRRQLRHRLRRGRARHLHVEPDEHRLYGDAVCAAQLGLYLRRQARERILGRRGRAAGGRPAADRGLWALFHRRRPARRPRVDPVHFPRAHRARVCLGARRLGVAPCGPLGLPSRPAGRPARLSR
jgi:MFS family permease